MKFKTAKIKNKQRKASSKWKSFLKVHSNALCPVSSDILRSKQDASEIHVATSCGCDLQAAGVHPFCFSNSHRHLRHCLPALVERWLFRYLSVRWLYCCQSEGRRVCGEQFSVCEFVPRTGMVRVACISCQTHNTH